jgi:FAD/FMN-containing dehydrogenase
MATVRPRSSRPLEADDSRNGTIPRVPPPPPQTGSKEETVVKGCRKEGTGFVSLEEAEVVIAGDGNLHATLVKDPAMPMETWNKNEAACLAELYQITRDLGGKISGEHGIGIKRREFLRNLMVPEELELMRAIKRAWDPNNIMNPGKIFTIYN